MVLPESVRLEKNEVMAAMAELVTLDSVELEPVSCVFLAEPVSALAYVAGDTVLVGVDGEELEAIGGVRVPDAAANEGLVVIEEAEGDFLSGL